MFDGLQEMNDKALQNLFNNFVNRIDIDNKKVVLTLRVSPFAPFVDKPAIGQPHVILSTNYLR